MTWFDLARNGAHSYIRQLAATLHASGAHQPSSCVCIDGNTELLVNGFLVVLPPIPMTTGCGSGIAGLISPVVLLQPYWHIDVVVNEQVYTFDPFSEWPTPPAYALLGRPWRELTIQEGGMAFIAQHGPVMYRHDGIHIGTIQLPRDHLLEQPTMLEWVCGLLRSHKVNWSANVCIQ